MEIGVLVQSLPKAWLWVVALIGTYLLLDIFQSGARFLVIIIAATFAFFYAIPVSLASILHYFGVTLFDTTPLRELIDRTFADRPLSIPTYVTASRDHYICDPVEPTAVAYGLPGGGVQFEASPWQSAWVSEYFDLSKEQPQSRNALLTATSALPYAIFPEVRINGLLYSDGGIADNSPILPLIVEDECTEIVVVLLRPTQKTWLRAKLRECRRINRRRVAAGLVSRTTVKLEGRSVRVLVISPPLRLGNFIFGTMNFRAKYTRALVDLGRRCANDAWRKQEWANASLGDFTETKATDYKDIMSIVSPDISDISEYVKRRLRIALARRGRRPPGPPERS